MLAPQAASGARDCPGQKPAGASRLPDAWTLTRADTRPRRARRRLLSSLLRLCAALRRYWPAVQQERLPSPTTRARKAKARPSTRFATPPAWARCTPPRKETVVLAALHPANAYGPNRPLRRLACREGVPRQETRRQNAGQSSRAVREPAAGPRTSRPGPHDDVSGFAGRLRDRRRRKCPDSA